MMTESEAYFALNMVDEIGPVRARKAVERFGALAPVLTASASDLQRIEGIGPELSRKIHGYIRAVEIDAEREKLDKLGLKVVTFADENYPPALREIYDPPLCLYYKGKLPDPCPKGMAVIGSRVTSHYGLETAKKLSYQIAYAGMPIISGLARGIDTAAHMGALAAKAVTWAVLGCGLDQVYPPENQELADKIVESGGCLISELPLGTAPTRQTFPRRNRIVSGLSFGVLVVEAGRNSGALITAKQALEQGRQIFAIPGRIDNPQSQGCHQLIKDGATLVEGVDDIFKALEFLLPVSEVTMTRPKPENLSVEEVKVFEMLGNDETPIDLLIEKSGLPSGAVSSTLLRLELKKLVKQLPGKVFVRTA